MANMWSLNPSDWFSQDTNAVPTLNPQQQQVSSQLAGYFGGLNPNSFDYSGQLTAPITSGQQDVVGQSARLGALANNTFSQIGQYDPTAVNQQFNQTIQQPALQNWTQNVAPLLRESMPAFSSEQGTTLSRALNTEQNNLDQMRMGYQQQAQTNALSALGQGAQFNATNMGIQSVPQELQQAGLTNAYNAFVQSNQQYQQSTNQMLSYLGIPTQALQVQPSLAQDFIGLGQAGAQIYGAYQGGQQQQQNSAQLAQIAAMAAQAGA